MRKYLRISIITMFLSIVVCLCSIFYTVNHFGSEFGLSARGVFYYTVRNETPPDETLEDVNLYWNDTWKFGKASGYYKLYEVSK